MPEFDEVLENFGDNFKENMKKPWFKVALVAVGALGGYALYKSMTRSGGAAESEAGVVYTSPGYAAMGGGNYYDSGTENYDNLLNYLDQFQMAQEETNNAIMERIDSVQTSQAESVEALKTSQAESMDAMMGHFDDLNSQLKEHMTNAAEVHNGLTDYLNDLQTSQDTTNNAIMSQIDTLVTKIGVQQEQNAKLQSEIERQNIISEMQANSNLYGGLQGSGWDSMKESLHDRNMELAEQIGATYDPNTGKYYTANGSVLYETIPDTPAKVENYKPKGSNNPAKIVVTSGTSTSVSSGSYASDSVALSEAGKRWNEAKAAGDEEGMKKAHADAEAIRAKYGYSGGEDGSQVIKK